MSDSRRFKVDTGIDADSLEELLNLRASECWLLANLFSAEHVATTGDIQMILTDNDGYRKMRYTVVWYNSGDNDVPLGYKVL